MSALRRTAQDIDSPVIGAFPVSLMGSSGKNSTLKAFWETSLKDIDMFVY